MQKVLKKLYTSLIKTAQVTGHLLRVVHYIWTLHVVTTTLRVDYKHVVTLTFIMYSINFYKQLRLLSQSIINKSINHPIKQ